ncbi:hypothetical protein DICPUDRAFT_55916 [Dictyostelium purpureum]|uniref:BAR domain-containing protein n=1 Tax=Dictyostelium purpureum TaxID=5786 RepID=F0ZP31_DICPU|nr:uncharacterized protein DICPUDRAFT_55916 [Dictyostelium purpureum]EGC34297.1 hypothetical protein DICPUDRAFT_55916 [Dictyostelium purpureum]|eukprot:XP_003289179.1 hypothetical protein DICPUDRAFT_55916 [Dictyostelium purpureum]
MSATRERTREVFGFKKENMEHPNVILYQQETEKLKRDYRELYEASKSWMDSLARMKVEGELLSNTYKNFGETQYHREGENLSKVSRYIDLFNNNVKNLYDNVEDHYFNEISDNYKFHIKNIEDQDAKTHKDKLAYEDALTIYNKPQLHETEQKTHARYNKMTTAQSVFLASFTQYQQLMADIEGRTEKQVPQAFRNLMNALDDFFDKGRQDFGFIDLPDWKKPEMSENMLESTLHQEHTNWDKPLNMEKEVPVLQKETIETKEEASGSGTKVTTTKTTTTTSAVDGEHLNKADTIGHGNM